jgi:hypothetical protein
LSNHPGSWDQAQQHDEASLCKPLTLTEGSSSKDLAACGMLGETLVIWGGLGEQTTLKSKLVKKSTVVILPQYIRFGRAVEVKTGMV